MKIRLRVQAAGNGRSMEEETWPILGEAVDRELVPAKGLRTALHKRFKPLGGV